MRLKRYLSKVKNSKNSIGDSKIVAIDYDSKNLIEKEITNLSEVRELKDQATVTWVDVQDGLEQTNLINIIGDNFGIHPLTLRDLQNSFHHPKIEDFKEYIFIVFKLLLYKDKKIIPKQVSLILSDSYVLSFQEIKNEIFETVKKKIRESRGKIREEGTDFLVYELINCLIENYFSVIEDLVEEIEAIEEKVIENPSKEDSQEIHRLKRELILIRKQIWPTRELATKLSRGDLFIIKQNTQIFMRDAYDRTIQILDTIESLRDVLSGVLDIYLSSISNKMNEIMKVLTIISTLFIPLTFVAGIYGMNFEFIPELKYKYSYPILWTILIVIVFFMLKWFKRNKWI